MADQEDGPARGHSPLPVDLNDEHVHFDDESTYTSTVSQSTSAMTSPLMPEFRDVKENEQDVPRLPTLSYNIPPTEEGSRRESIGGYGTDEEASVCKPFLRTSSPNLDFKRNKGAEYEKVGDLGVCTMQKFSLYETATRYYVVGADILDSRFRILKIDRTAEIGTLHITEDEIVYTKKEMTQLLNAIDDGNKSSGGMKLKSAVWGILGFIRFTGCYYMHMITKRNQNAMIGGHFVYTIEATELIPLTTSTNSRFKSSDTRNTEESRFLSILNGLDLNKSFYFSYSYDITRTLQHNIMKERAALAAGKPSPHPKDYNSMFVWNSHLLKPAESVLKNTYDWCVPVIHGYLAQAALPVWGRIVYITIIARRSRYFAGARFLKRGTNDMGYVANDVETEQIVSENMTTSLHAPGPKLYASPNYTSYVQHRGSIPLHWTQDNTGVTPKPPIELNLVDPFYSAAALHFDNLFERYGAPVYVLNLVKAKERTPRESKLLYEFTDAINYLNQFLPEDKKIIHKPWDMSRASKSRDQDVIGTLENMANEVVTRTGIFHNGDGKTSIPTVQNGVARTNCIDCLDRTNAAQFVIGKRALGYQLYALGILSEPSINYDTDAINLFTSMYHGHGDTIAIQYGGSQLVNTMETYRKINQWTSQSRDMVESFRRYYNNSFLDGQRQEAYNLFLGNYTYVQGQPLLWDLATDYYLHHTDPRVWSPRTRRSYINWYTPSFLEKKILPPYSDPQGALANKPVNYFDDYWIEYYKPLSISSIVKIFTYPGGKMTSTARLMPRPQHRDESRVGYDVSPFKVRADVTAHVEEQPVPHVSPNSKGKKKEVSFPEPTGIIADDEVPEDSSMKSVSTGAKRIGLQRWLQPIHESHPLSERVPHHSKAPHNFHHNPPGIMKETSSHSQSHSTEDSFLNSLNNNSPNINLSGNVGGIEKKKMTPLDKSKAAQWTFTQVVSESLNPSVNLGEEEDYERYVEYPQLLSLVVGDDDHDIEGVEEYEEWVRGAGWDGGSGQGGYSGGINGGWGREEDHEEIEEYRSFLRVAENPLTVLEEDGQKKRYKAYRKWLAGKSLFKQQPID
ncbi:hypothetical protein MFRU_011g02160 [Monilinia fructicola]|uniref:SAC domain-containing protein n=1 Tax=Monilinia fructicola TaxID=38448 RepID=A0A5M9JN80_MONFR|nr:hypothetical protein EYC84_000116 [Monilinia fructicola]KAG4030761.1 hypothetical protein MFRU_011g02160 [Monilinia fructicola]